MIRTAVFALSFLMNLRFKQVNDVPMYFLIIITTKEIIGNFTAKYPKPKTVTLEKPQLQAC